MVLNIGQSGNQIILFGNVASAGLDLIQLVGMSISINSNFTYNVIRANITFDKSGDGTKFLSDNGTYKSIDLSSKQDKVVSDFVESTLTNSQLEITTSDTVSVALGKLQKAIKDNEEVEAQAMSEFKNAVGLTDNVKLPDLSSTHYLNGKTNIMDCLIALDNKIYELEQALTVKE